MGNTVLRDVVVIGALGTGLALGFANKEKVYAAAGLTHPSAPVETMQSAKPASPCCHTAAVSSLFLNLVTTGSFGQMRASIAAMCASSLIQAHPLLRSR